MKNCHNFFYDNKWSNCPLSLADVSHEFQIHVSVQIHVSNERARISAVIVKTMCYTMSGYHLCGFTWSDQVVHALCK